MRAMGSRESNPPILYILLLWSERVFGIFMAKINWILSTIVIDKNKQKIMVKRYDWSVIKDIYTGPRSKLAIHFSASNYFICVCSIFHVWNLTFTRIQLWRAETFAAASAMMTTAMLVMVAVKIIITRILSSWNPRLHISLDQDIISFFFICLLLIKYIRVYFHRHCNLSHTRARG